MTNERLLYDPEGFWQDLIAEAPPPTAEEIRRAAEATPDLIDPDVFKEHIRSLPAEKKASGAAIVERLKATADFDEASARDYLKIPKGPIYGCEAVVYTDPLLEFDRPTPTPVVPNEIDRDAEDPVRERMLDDDTVMGLPVGNIAIQSKEYSELPGLRLSFSSVNTSSPDRPTGGATIYVLTSIPPLMRFLESKPAYQAIHYRCFSEFGDHDSSPYHGRWLDDRFVEANIDDIDLIVASEGTIPFSALAEWNAEFETILERYYDWVRNASLERQRLHLDNGLVVPVNVRDGPAETTEIGEQ